LLHERSHANPAATRESHTSRESRNRRQAPSGSVRPRPRSSQPHEITAECVRTLLAARKAWQRRYVRSARLSLGRESRDHTPPGIGAQDGSVVLVRSTAEVG
jgi:hypothetical protein